MLRQRENRLTVAVMGSRVGVAGSNARGMAGECEVFLACRNEFSENLGPHIFKQRTILFLQSHLFTSFIAHSTGR